MDQRSSTSVEELLQISKNALKAGDYAVAKDYAQKANLLFPMNREARLIINQVMGLQGRPPEASTSPPNPGLSSARPPMDIPPGQEPRRPAPLPQPPARLSPSGTQRPEDASGRWELSLKQSTASSMGGGSSHRFPAAAPPSGQARERFSAPSPKPFIPSPDRTSSSPLSKPPGGFAWTEDRKPSEGAPILEGATRLVTDGVMIAGATVRAAAGQALGQVQRITARGALLSASFLALMAFGVYASAINVRTFGISVFPDPAPINSNSGPRTGPAAQSGSTLGTPAVTQARPAARIIRTQSASTPVVAAESTGADRDSATVEAGLGLPPLQSATTGSQPKPGSSSRETPATPATNNVQELAAKAREMLTQSKPAEAAEFLQAALPKVQSVSRPGIVALLAQAHFDHGNLLVTQNKLGEAISAYRRAIEHSPREAKYHLHLGSAYFEEAKSLKLQRKQSLEQYRLAAVATEKARELDPNDLTTHQLLAVTYEALGRTSDARKSWQAVLKLAPAGSQEALAADKKLKRLPRQS